MEQKRSGGTGKGDSASPILLLDGLASEGLRHIPLHIWQYLGSPEHRCRLCFNNIARTCKSVHRWFYSTFDEPEACAEEVEEEGEEEEE